MYKYALLKMFHHDRQIQFYMYAFIYVNSDTMPVEEFFQLQFFVENYKKFSTPVPVPKHCLLFSYTCSEDYELDQKFDKT